MNPFEKLRFVLGVKGAFCLLSLFMIAFALTTYSATVTITPYQPFSQGATSASWTAYFNQNQTGYLPGGASEPTLSTGDSSTYAFKVNTDAVEVCAIKIELTSAIASSNFSNFNITVEQSNGGAWSSGTLYNALTGSTSIPYINGLVSGDAGYVHQGLSTTMYYLIKVTFTYVGTGTSPIYATFQYTPLPETSF
jgi:hypothetical protein